GIRCIQPFYPNARPLYGRPSIQRIQREPGRPPARKPRPARLRSAATARLIPANAGWPRSAPAGPYGRLGPEGLDDLFPRFDVGPAYQVYAIRHGREDARHGGLPVAALQAFQRLFDGLGLPRQVDDEGGMVGGFAYDGHLPGKNG